MEELQDYFGLRILMEIVKLPALPMYWSKDTALNQHEVTSYSSEYIPISIVKNKD